MLSVNQAGVQEIERVVVDVVHFLLPNLNVLLVTSCMATYGDDHEVWRLTVVLDRFPAGGPGNWPVLAVIGAIHQALVDSGLSKFPVIDFVAKEEFEAQ